jgi:hypothetical protein
MIRSTPLLIGPKGIQTLNPGPAHPHYAHDPADRVRCTITPNPNGVSMVNFTNDPVGDTYFLPYRPNEVHSMRLPANPGFPAVFLTANLDGCWMFIDKKTNGDLVVYHANASAGVAPTLQQSATQPTFQTAGAIAALLGHYVTATPFYAGTANALHFELRKSRYLREVDNRLQRKTNRGRTGVQFGGGVEHGSLTTFAGFFRHNAWEFWFQTYSQFYYDRPQGHIKSKFGFQRVNPDVTHDPYKIIEATLWALIH